MLLQTLVRVSSLDLVSRNPILYFFATPLEPSPLDQCRSSCFSLFPVAAVLDLTPDDANLSAGFAHAGFRIHAVIGFDAERHQSWKVSNMPGVDG